jgi:hypothetical protein
MKILKCLLQVLKENRNLRVSRLHLYFLSTPLVSVGLGRVEMMFIVGMVERMTGWKHRNSWLRAAEISDILKDVQKREWCVVC